ncbi:MAG: AsmA family protein [Rikenellaceae bacterium]
MIIRKVIKWVIIVFVVVNLFVGGLVGLLLTPQVLTPRVLDIAQRSIKTEVSIKSVDLSLFTRFPSLTLRIDSLRIAQAKDSIGDLLFVKECRIAVDPWALLTRTIKVNHVSLSGASLYVYVDSLHGPLRSHFIMPEVAESVTTAEDSTSFDLSAYNVLLRRLKVDSMQIVIDDRTKEFYTRVDNYGVDMSMRLSSHICGMDVKSGFSNLIVWHKGDLLVKKTSMAIDTKAKFDMDSLKVSFERADLRLNGIDFHSSGMVQRDTITQSTYMDITSSLSTPSLAEFLELVPASIIESKEKIKTEGQVALDVKVEGHYAADILPTISATIKVDDAMARYQSRKLALESVSCDAFVYVDMNEPKRSYADVNRFFVNTSEIISLDVKGKVSNFLEDPLVDVAVKSDIDFDRFTELFPLNESIVCSGRSQSDLTANFTLSDITNSNFAKLYINGETRFTDMEISLDASKFEQDTTSMDYLYLQAESGNMIFGDKVRPDTDSRTLLATIDFSGLGYKSKAGEYLSIRNIDLSVGANFDRNSSSVNGVGIRGVAQNMVVGVDSLFSSELESSDVTFTLSPKSEQREAVVKALISSSQISVSEPIYNSEISLSSVEMNLDMIRLEPRLWDMDGAVQFSDLTLFTDLFPIDITVPQSSAKVSNRTIELTNAEMSIGESQIIATGHINNLLQKLFVDPRTTISGEMQVNSSLLNISELMVATNSSVLLLEEFDDLEEVTAVNGMEGFAGIEALEEVNAIEEEEEELSEEEAAAMEEYIEADSILSEVVIRREEMQQADSLNRRGGPPHEGEPSTIFLVPRMMDFTFDVNIDLATFEEAKIEDITGQVKIKDGLLSLEDLSLKAIGAEGTGSMSYSNLSRNSSNVAFNMVLSDVDINRIGELSPSINTMFPMLQSFEGIVDFTLKANTTLDSESMIDFENFVSAMSFKGRDLVLMDSETFTALSKTLMFKNKDRNLIDELEVYALVNKNTITVLPFPMTMDRYEAIIGGSQDVNPESFEVDYSYHISIMKSPLPFKAGVNITGDLTDFKFKVTSAKLKNSNFDTQKKIYEAFNGSIVEKAVVPERKRREQQQQ